MDNTINMPVSHRYFFFRIIILSFPPAIIAMVAVADARVGAIAGFLLAVFVAAISPVYAFPVLLIGAALNNIEFIFGLQFGWILIAGCALGAVIYTLLDRNNLRIDASVMLLILTFTILEVSIGIIGGDGRLDRLAALLAVLVFIGILASSNPHVAMERYFNNDLMRALIYLVGCVGIILVFVTLSMLSSQEFRLSRAGELGLSIGDTESSPRSLSNILGIVVVTCMSGVISVPGKALDKLAWGAMGIAALVGMFYTGSRMPAIAASFGIALAVVVQLFFFGRKLRASTIIWTVTGITVVVLLAMLMAAHGPGLLPFIDSGVSNFRLFRIPSIESNTRLDMWGNHFNNVSVAQLLMGSGIGSMGNPHSLIVGALGAFGIVGIGVLGYFIFTLALQSMKVRSTVAITTLAYTLLALSSSSDIDKSYFWVMSTVVILSIRLSRAQDVIS
ncbi:hypothetical protein [Halomonas rhizosphaerae]|uniref:O-antigen ligase domain-containing protein n=1 Tax=Halomonas rhizosphaerae TaxID=3043296 RepID=A0ABT6V0Y1_9GAMM|nr:hypothetical protein [Halomonas rhizosphaerae]MDI5891879.1 hypothetical protein [Halomonas rhizosphaerae]